MRFGLFKSFENNFWFAHDSGDNLHWTKSRGLRP